MHKAGPTVDFMRKMMKFRKMPLLLLPMSQEYVRNSGTQIIRIAIPNEGEGQNFNNGQSICQYFSNFTWHAWKFRKCTNLQQVILILGDANIEISQTSLYEEARKSKLCQLCLILKQNMTII